MKKSMDEIILEAFPLRSYAADRLAQGHMELVEEAQRRELAQGVVFRECLYRRGDGKAVWVYLTAIAPDAPVQLAVSAAALRTAKSVRDHARTFEERFDTPVLYAMNASYFHFFNNGDLTPYGIQVVRGVEMALPAMQDKDKPWYSHNFLAVDRAGKAFISNSEAYYQHWQGKLSYAVGGGLRLIREGKICLHSDQQGSAPACAPRTTVGIAADGSVILMCADGRTKRSAGLSYGDIIEIYQQQGPEIRELLNLDGGGSTTVVVKENGEHRVMNVPSGPQLPIPYARYGLKQDEPIADEQARPVADAVLIIPK